MAFVALYSLRTAGAQPEALVVAVRAELPHGLNSLPLIQKEGLDPYRSPEP